MKAQIYKEYEKRNDENCGETRKGKYRIRDFLKPTSLELGIMALESPISLPWIVGSINEAVHGRYFNAVAAGVAAITPQGLTYLAGRGLEVWAYFNRNNRPTILYYFRKAKIPKIN